MLRAKRRRYEVGIESRPERNQNFELIDRTIINVCHKFNDGTLALYDEIVIIENGEITLKGNFEDIKDKPKLKLYRNVP